MAESVRWRFHASQVELVLVAMLAVFVVPQHAGSQAMNADHSGGMLHPAPNRPSFEVASIHQSAPGADVRFSGIEMRPGTFKASGVSTKELIAFAYAVPDEKQIFGGLSWINTERFDVIAKTSSADNSALRSLPPSKLHDQFRIRLQSLLEDRFKLQVSFATKQLPLFFLDVANSGLKCKRVGANNAIAFDNPAGAPPPPQPEASRRMPGVGHEAERNQLHWKSVGLPFPLILSWISQQAEVGGRTLIDKTGLDGEFDCEITWSRDEEDSTESSFFTALREQMGLRLRPERGPVETMVVDKIEQPSAN
jgi:uncharacterized protein (TIGR03435 family)